MNKRLYGLVVSAAVLLPSCSSLTNGTAQLPSVHSVPLQSLGKLTFAVGTARLQDGSTGLSVVAYMRQANGLTAFLVDTPSVTGPSGFTVPVSSLPANGAGGSGSDAGTATINATSQTASPPPSTTFGTGGGVYGGGLGPFNATQTSSNFYPGNSNPSSGAPGAYLTPFYETASGSTKVPAPSDPVVLLVGPPAKGISVFNNVDFPSSPPFAGYLPGFTAFEAAPAAGTYSMTVNVSAANAAGATFTASAHLNSVTPLPAIPAPAFAEDANKDGGGTATISIPADPRIVETLIFVHDTASNAFYAIGPIAGTGVHTGTLPAALGACNVPPCSTPTMAAGDTYVVSAVSFDYPDFESIQPVNGQQVPTVLGSAGQADVSISPATTGVY